MTDIIHINTTRIREMFCQAEEYSVATGDMRKQMESEITNAGDMRKRMESEIANIRVQTDSMMAAGVVIQLLRTIDKAEIVCKYADEFIKLAATTETSLDNLKISMAMMESRNAIESEIRLLADRFRHKNEKN